MGNNHLAVIMYVLFSEMCGIDRLEPGSRLLMVAICCSKIAMMPCKMNAKSFGRC